MQDWNWKTWALAAMVGLAVLAQLLKHVPATRALMTFDSETAIVGNSSPYSVKVSRNRRSQYGGPMSVKTRPDYGAVPREQLEHFVAANTPTATTFETPTDATAAGKDGKTAKKEEEKCDPKVLKLDPKTGQPVPCKTKKKKDKEEEIAKVAPPEPPKAPPTSDSSNDTLDQTLNQAIASGQIPQPLPNKPDTPFDSLENWEKLLLDHPDLNETKAFIDQYQRGIVTADIFYKVVQLMISDSRPDMNSLGILCAGLTPSLMSFQLLANVDKSLRSDSPVRQQADGFLARYGQDASYLSILDLVLRSAATGYPTVLAEQKVDESAHRNLTLGASPTPAQTATHAKNVTRYMHYVALLQNLEHSTDPNVANQARNSLSDLQTLLGVNTTNPTTPTTPGTVALTQAQTP